MTRSLRVKATKYVTIFLFLSCHHKENSEINFSASAMAIFPIPKHFPMNKMGIVARGKSVVVSMAKGATVKNGRI